MYIEKINGPADVKKLTLEELPVLAGKYDRHCLSGQVSMEDILDRILVW